MTFTSLKRLAPTLLFLPFLACIDHDAENDQGFDDENTSDDSDLEAADVSDLGAAGMDDLDVADAPDALDVYELAGVNNASDHIVLYDNNVENLVTCSGNNWKLRMLHYMKTHTSPDIFTVQQISNQTQLDELTAEMSAALSGTYAGVIALGSTGSMGYPPNTCRAKKNHQTNAIIYRTDRFTLETTIHWRSDAPQDWDHGTGKCVNLVNTPTSQDRVENVAARFYDNRTHQRISVASFHWPTNTWHGPKCADENMHEANAVLDGLGGTLKIAAGDANTGPHQWWSDARSLHYRDPIAETCPSSGCPNTNKSGRIDFILAKSGHGFRNAKTISNSAAGGPYSDHRALRADVYF